MQYGVQWTSVVLTLVNLIIQDEARIEYCGGAGPEHDVVDNNYSSSSSNYRAVASYNGNIHTSRVNI